MNVRVIYLCCIALLTISLLACTESRKETEEDFFVVDLSKAVKEGPLNISELVDSLCVIPLETTEEALVPDYFNLWRGEKYILILGREAVLQFATDGRFIRKLASQGRGPKEFNYISGYAVDEANEKIYISGFDGRVKQYNLATGEFLDGRKWEHGVISRAVFSQDHRLVYVPYLSMEDSSTYDVCQTTWDGKWLSGVKAEPCDGGDKVGDIYLNEVGGEVHFVGIDNDTLYVIRDSVKVPKFFIEIPERYSSIKKRGNIFLMDMETPDLCVFTVNEQVVTEFEGGMSVSWEPIQKYVLNKEDRKLREIDHVYTDMWGKSQSLTEFHQSGDYLTTYLSVLELMKLEEVWKKSGKVDATKLDRLRRLLEKVKEDDNPFLLTGKVRY